MLKILQEYTHRYTSDLKNIRKKQNEKGITLIALVVTIIILIILAGITIATLTGENGLFARAKEAKLEAKRSQIIEWLNLKLIEEQAEDIDRTSEGIIIATRENVIKNQNELKQMGKDVSIGEILNETINEDPKKVNTYFEVIVDGDTYKVEMSGAKLRNSSGDLEDIKLAVNEKTVKIMRKADGNVEAKTMITGTEAYIKFSVDTDLGVNIKIEPALPCKITKNGLYEFTITGTKENARTKVIKYTVNVNKYVENPEAWVDFKGTSYIECKDFNQNNLMNGFTIATKVRINRKEQNGIKYMGIFGNHLDDHGIALQFFDNSTTLGGADYNPYYDKWTDIVMTYEVLEDNRGIYKTYVNGDCLNESNVKLNPYEGFYIGNAIEPKYGDRRMNGEMSCIKIWNKALNENEVNELDLFKDNVDIQNEFLYKNIMLKSQEEVEKFGTFVGIGHEFMK